MKACKLLIVLFGFSEILLLAATVAISLKPVELPDIGQFLITKAFEQEAGILHPIPAEEPRLNIMNRFSKPKPSVAPPQETPVRASPVNRTEVTLTVIGKVIDEGGVEWLYIKDHSTNRIHKARLDGTVSGEISVMSYDKSQFTIKWKDRVLTIQGER